MTSQRTILIVEDEPLIAMMLEDFLDMLGHAVRGPVDTVAAGVATLAEGKPDLAIVDVNLRGGEAVWPLADALADAGVPFVLATGGHVNLPPERHAGAPVLQKPYTMDDVEGVLARTFG